MNLIYNIKGEGFTVYNYMEDINYCNSVDIVFVPKWDLDKKIMVSEKVNKLAIIFPNWLRTVYLTYDHDDDEHNEEDGISLAFCTSDEVYKNASVNLTKQFFDISEEEMDRVLVHEFCHIVVGPLTNYAFKNCRTKGSSGEVIDRVETITTDLEMLICRLMGYNIDYPAYKEFTKDLRTIKSQQGD